MFYNHFFASKRTAVRKSSVLGMSAAAVYILLWLSFNFVNPYTGLESAGLAPLMCTGWTLLAPDASWFAQPYPLLAAFLWSLPVSLYMACMPSIYALFGLTSAAYSIAYVMIRFGRQPLIEIEQESKETAAGH